MFKIIFVTDGRIDMTIRMSHIDAENLLRDIIQSGRLGLIVPA